MATGQQSNLEFLRRVEDYLPADAEVRTVDHNGQPESPREVEALRGDTFYHLDCEAMLAASHAIEDLALEEGNGSFLATFRDFTTFSQARERYALLAATIDEVIIVAGGRKPRPCCRIQFIPAHDSVIRDFWTVLYQGRHTQAMLLTRQANSASLATERKYVGFYTFDARLVARVRRDIVDLLSGAVPNLREYDRMHAIDHTVKHTRAVFFRERQELETALLKLRMKRAGYQTRHFAHDLDRILDRLQRIKSCLSESPE